MKIPADITARISQRASEIAKVLAPRKTGKGANALRPASAEGQVGIEIPPEVQYMRYQNDGVESRLQTELAGRTIPIRLSSGSVIFRRATSSNIGRVRLVSRDEHGDLISTKTTWEHPGIEGKHFAEKALRQATSEWVQTLTGQEVLRMLEESAVRDIMMILEGRG